MSLKLDTVVEQLQAFLHHGYNDEEEGTSPFFLFRLVDGAVETKMMPPPANDLIKQLYMRLAQMTASDPETEMVGIAFEAFYKVTTSLEEAQDYVGKGVSDADAQECMMFMMQERGGDKYAGMGQIEDVNGVKKITVWQDFGSTASMAGSMSINFF